MYVRKVFGIYFIDVEINALKHVVTKHSTRVPGDARVSIC